jgi:hypothetical protein
LDKEDLQTIECKRMKSAGNSYYVHLYQQDDVIKIALNKYGGLDKFLNGKKWRENRKIIRGWKRSSPPPLTLTNRKRFRYPQCYPQCSYSPAIARLWQKY